MKILPKIATKLTREFGYLTGRFTTLPEYVSLIVTFNCNFKCRSCSVWTKTNTSELNDSQWREIAEQLCHFLPPSTFIEINGGEPLLRKPLAINLIKQLKSHFHTVALNTNGSTIDETTLIELKEAGLDIIKLSLYSLDGATHNNLRGSDIAFDHATSAVKLINQSGLKLEIGTLITSQNIAELPKLISYITNLPDTNIILQPLDEKIESIESKNFSTNILPRDLWPDEKDTISFFDWLEEDGNARKIKNSPMAIEAMKKYYLNAKSALDYRCFAGQRNLIIYPNGDLSFCFKRPKFGSISDGSIINPIKTANVERKYIAKCPKYCRIVGCNISRGIKEIFVK
jgi:MoaA/NifB/PqqE/SkfB family radical SAM enzyme